MSTPGDTFRRLRRIAGWLAPLAAFAVILAVVRSAGVPLTLPGILLVIILLGAARLMIGRARRHRRDRSVTRPRGSR
ncbi:hypothetical protein [Microbacterium testaceum]|uniref:hypothetical protein n=1 Tax=Microbacterium testaceum TaxID=2033 RepID=UPI002435FFF3|nr:hypothetical protein [Microbacterium testaceum]